jgi:hypothetical protein
MPKLTVEVEWPADLEMSRDDLDNILADVMFAPDKSLLSPISIDESQRDHYPGGKYAGVRYYWKVTS